MSPLRLPTLPRVKAVAIRLLSRRFATTRITKQQSGPIQAQSLTFSSFGDPSSVLRLQSHDIDQNHLSSKSILLRTLVAPINPADINVIQGTYGELPRFIPSLFGPGVEPVDPPAAVPGNEGVFEVQATGVDVSNEQFAPGDWVIPLTPGYGTWRSHVLTSTTDVHLWKIPTYLREKGLQPVQAASVAVNPLTALRLVEDFGTRWDDATGKEVSGLVEGDWLLQNGANSSVGRLVIQLAKMRGIRTLNVVREREEKFNTENLRQDLLTLGADIVVTQSQLGLELRSKLDEASSGRGANLMLDCVGGASAISLAKNLNLGAEVVTYGAMSKAPLRPGTGMMIFKDLRFRGFWVTRWGQRFPQKKKEAVEGLLKLMVEGKLKTSAVEMMPWHGCEVRMARAVGWTLDGFRKGKYVWKFPPEGELPTPLLGTGIGIGLSR